MTATQHRARKTTAVANSGYRLFNAGAECGDRYSTIDEALRQAARYTRLNVAAVVVVREHHGGRVRAVASGGKAYFVSSCAACYGVGGILGGDFCSACSGDGYVADPVAAARG